jgi:hypothetical protein
MTQPHPAYPRGDGVPEERESQKDLLFLSAKLKDTVRHHARINRVQRTLSPLSLRSYSLSGLHAYGII